MAKKQQNIGKIEAASKCDKVFESNIYELQDNYRRGVWKIPTWQRGDIWSKSKKEEFKKTILTKSHTKDHMPGVIVLFYLEGSNQYYMSDGVQRSSTSEQIYKELVGEYGDVDMAKDILSSVTVSVQLFKYQTEEEAKTDFIRLNNGTSFTNYEQGYTVLSDLTPFDQWNRDILGGINEIVNGSSKRLGLKVGNSRSKKDKHKRDNLALFLRFVTKDTMASSYACSSKLTLSDFSNPEKRKNLIESRLVKYFQKNGLGESKKAVIDFGRFVDAEVALFEEVWEEIDKTGWHATVQTVTDATWRWMLCAAIYRRNNDIPRNTYRQFLKDLLTFTRGRSSVLNENKQTCTYKLSDLSRLGLIQEYSNAWLDKSVGAKVGRKRKQINQIKSGYDNAHIKPYSFYGEGDTKPAPAADNRSEGVGYGLFSKDCLGN